MAAAMALLVACSKPAAETKESRLQQVLKRGHVVVAVTGEFPPLGFTDEKGELVGFDIDFARLLAKALFQDESKVKFEKISNDARWPTVLTGKADVGVMGTTIWPDRFAKVAFTDVYLDSGVSVLVRKEAGITSIQGLNDPKFTIARQAVPTEEAIKKKYWPDAKEIVLSSISDMFTAVKNGRADFTIIGTPVVAYHAAKNPELIALNELVSDATQYGMFMAPGDFEWWLYLNQFVHQARSGSLYGDYSKIHQKWFGSPPPPQNWYIKTSG
jgi:polar amino acid transport system substrate-binding protein